MSEALVPEASATLVGPDPTARVERLALDDTSWIDVSRRWLRGADALYESLLHGVAWQKGRLFRYDHVVEERRLGSFWTKGRPLPHPALADVHRCLQKAYGVPFDGFGMIHYRDGRDGQGFHRDTDMRWLDDTIIAILTLGATRPWLVRPRSAKHTAAIGGGATHDLQPASGDLLVMGGRAQADWEHSVPYLGGTPVAPRISLQWRFARHTGQPFLGGSYRAPLTYRR